MRRVNILGVEISAVNKETAIQYLYKNMDKARGKYICACNVHTTVTAHENLDYGAKFAAFIDEAVADSIRGLEVREDDMQKFSFCRMN